MHKGLQLIEKIISRCDRLLIKSDIKDMLNNVGVNGRITEVREGNLSRDLKRHGSFSNASAAKPARQQRRSQVRQIGPVFSTLPNHEHD